MIVLQLIIKLHELTCSIKIVIVRSLLELYLILISIITVAIGFE
jgi:hypothetical protein